MNFNKEYFQENVPALYCLCEFIKSTENTEIILDIDEEEHLRLLCSSFTNIYISKKNLKEFRNYLMIHGDTDNLIKIPPYQLSPLIAARWIVMHIIKNFNIEFKPETVDSNKCCRILTVLFSTVITNDDPRIPLLKKMLRKTGFKLTAIQLFCDKIEKSRKTLEDCLLIVQTYLNKNITVAEKLIDKRYKKYLEGVLNESLNMYNQENVQVTLESYNIVDVQVFLEQVHTNIQKAKEIKEDINSENIDFEQHLKKCFITKKSCTVALHDNIKMLPKREKKKSETFLKKNNLVWANLRRWGYLPGIIKEIDEDIVKIYLNKNSTGFVMVKRYDIRPFESMSITEVSKDHKKKSYLQQVLKQLNL